MTDHLTLAGGCFWCTEAVFKDVIGVESVESGYIGGHIADPSYKQVCGGDTGHAEAIRVGFDPDQVSAGDLLDIFFATHDPTQLNRQGNDVGTQYRSAMFPASPEQEAEMRAAIERGRRKRQSKPDRHHGSSRCRPGNPPRAITRIIGRPRGRSNPYCLGGDPRQAPEAAQELRGALQGGQRRNGTENGRRSVQRRHDQGVTQ